MRISILSSLLVLAAPLVAAVPAATESHPIPAEVYKTGNKFPLANWGHLQVHDPNIVFHEKTYYLFKGGVGVMIFKSNDISGPWKKVGTVLEGNSTIPNKGTANRPWAPTTVVRDGTFYCYYTLSSVGKRNSAIGVATTKNPEGKWDDHGLVIQTGGGTGSEIHPYNVTNAIDASIIFDEKSGQGYLIWGSFWQCIWQVPLSDDLLSVKNPKKPDAKQLTLIPNAEHKPEEGSWMSYHDGYYYVWYSRGKCCAFIRKGFPALGAEYKIQVGRSKDVRGPFLDKNGKKLVEGGGTDVYASNHGIVYAPGGLGVLPAHNGKGDILYYHFQNTSIGFKDNVSPDSLIWETWKLIIFYSKHNWVGTT